MDTAGINERVGEADIQYALTSLISFALGIPLMLVTVATSQNPLVVYFSLDGALPQLERDNSNLDGM